MFKINAPNKDYTGISASVTFSKGIGLTERKELIPWFKAHGYEVEEVPEGKPVDDMTVDELKAYAEGKEIDLTGLTKKEDILNKVKAGK